MNLQDEPGQDSKRSLKIGHDRFSWDIGACSKIQEPNKLFPSGDLYCSD
jgi:hypothetical protein